MAMRFPSTARSARSGAWRSASSPSRSFTWQKTDLDPDKYAETADKLALAEIYAKELGLSAELALIKRIRGHSDPAQELNCLTFL